MCRGAGGDIFCDTCARYHGFYSSVAERYNAADKEYDVPVSRLSCVRATSEVGVTFVTKSDVLYSVV